MRYVALMLLLVLLSTLVDTGVAHAQHRPGRDTGGEAVDRQAMRATIEATDRARRAEAEAWAAARDLPLRGRGVAGRPVQLVGVDGRRPVYLTTLNHEAALATGTTSLHPGAHLGLALTGAGLAIGLWDAGHALSTHREFAGRITTGDAAAPDNHATHVAGTLAATGVDGRARGMAYEALIRSYDWTNDATEMSGEAARGLLVSNHSYGAIAGWYYGDLDGTTGWYWFGDATISQREDYLFGWYGTEAAQFDRAVATSATYLPVVAAGNDREDRAPDSGTYRALDADHEWRTYDVATFPRPSDGGAEGYDTIAGAAVAKNVLTVGSIGFGGATPRVSAFSSFGPTDDGRLKPDLVGYGERVYSALSDGPDRYGASSGTSMATPNVAGSLLLLQQHAQDLRGAPLRAETLKGLALHTARDLGRAGPDYQYGWGLLDAEAAARQLSDAPGNPIAVLEATLDAGRVYTHRATVTTAGPLRVTLAWTDPPSSRRPIRGPSSLDDPTPHLRHDLDLRVVDEATGTVYAPYVLDPRDPSAPARPGDNVLDPVEQVFVGHIEPGTYVIQVSHKGSLDADRQPFALLTSGAADAARPVAVGPIEATAEIDAVVLTWRSVFERAGGTLRVERASVRYGAGNTRQVDSAEAVAEVPLRGLTEGGHAYDYRDAGLLSGRYLYRLVYADGLLEQVLGEVEVNLVPPATLGVLSSYPNPFSDAATLVVDLPERQHVRVAVYDVLGRRKAEVLDETLAAGRHAVAIDGAAWAPGVYFVRVETPRGPLTHQMIKSR